MAELTYNQRYGRLEAGDAIYTIAEECGMGDDWAMETIKRIEAEVMAKTGIDLSKA